MKKIFIALMAPVLITTAIVIAYSQKRGDENFGGRPSFPPAPFLSERFAKDANLTDEQKTKIKQIHEAERSTIETLATEARDIQTQLAALGTDGVFDQAKVSELAARLAENTKQMTIEREKTKAAIFAVLTAEQRAKAATISERFKQGPPPPPPAGFGGERERPAPPQNF